MSKYGLGLKALQMGITVSLDIGMVYQQFNLFPHLTALESVAFGPCKAWEISKQKATDITRDLLAKVGLAAFENKRPDQLSGGQQQLVAIARALAVSPKVLVFDASTSALGPEMIGKVLDVMQNVAKDSGMTMVVAAHEVGFASQVGDRLIFMGEGLIVEEDKPGEVMKN